MSSQTINPPQLAMPRGYSHGVIANGRVLALAGQIGWDQNSKLVSDDLGAQFVQALKNLLKVVRVAGGEPTDIVALRIFVTDKRKYIAAARAIGEQYQALFGKHYPAMSLVQVADLLEEGALVEIEGLAVLPQKG